jgi:hypothetical protein
MQADAAATDRSTSSLAAACTFGLAKNHPYFDGNARVGYHNCLVITDFCESSRRPSTSGQRGIHAWPGTPQPW